jgi:hypothetical protein
MDEHLLAAADWDLPDIRNQRLTFPKEPDSISHGFTWTCSAPDSTCRRNGISLWLTSAGSSDAANVAVALIRAPLNLYVFRTAC